MGADGANSRVRRQYLPHARRVDLAILAVGGKFVLDEQTRTRLPRRLIEGPNNIVPPPGSWMFSAPYEAGGAPIDLGIGGDEAAESEPPDLLFDNTRDYVFWAYVARPDRYRVARDVRTLGGADLQRAVLRLIDGWHTDLRRLVAESGRDPQYDAARGHRRQHRAA